ncbi:carboxymuconolactone decarboxylase family protein [uncultured Albimonas sp.]|uniref:carboxymuconolactone decarboxylase family protein n=1 Tax=uncultured Albimonas sp. TaxID=1331701 RepID=UPI0030EC6AC7|tara:strand:- start:13049 stop:13612 length:564 start_codon:yes stop_codon:yes gene_type:complete
MIEFAKHDETTAPEGSKPLIEKSKAAFGRLPGLHAVLAESPAAYEGYQVLHALFLQTSFTDEEKTVVWQTINVENRCHYCVPAHTGIAKAMKVDDAISQALRDETPLPTPKLEALRTFILQVMRGRGDVPEADLKAFLGAGFTRQNVLEVILGLSQKIISNYTNRFAQTPVDPVMQKFAWEPADKAA